MKSTAQFTLNGRPASLDTDDDRMLLWVLRTDLELTGTKYGCGEGICGACTVVVDGKAVRSCLTLLERVAGKDVVTIEGLARDGKLHPLQQAFIDHGAFQCGYCTSGMLLNAYALLLQQPRPSRDAIVGAHGAQPLPLRRPSDASSPPSRMRSTKWRRAMSAARDRPAHFSNCSAAASSCSFGLELDGLFARSGAPTPRTSTPTCVIGANGRVTVFSGKIEMGQGVMTSQAQMAGRGAGRALWRRSTWCWATPTAARGTWARSAR